MSGHSLSGVRVEKSLNLQDDPLYLQLSTVSKIVKDNEKNVSL